MFNIPAQQVSALTCAPTCSTSDGKRVQAAHTDGVEEALFARIEGGSHEWLRRHPWCAEFVVRSIVRCCSKLKQHPVRRVVDRGLEIAGAYSHERSSNVFHVSADRIQFHLDVMFEFSAEAH